MVFREMIPSEEELDGAIKPEIDGRSVNGMEDVSLYVQFAAVLGVARDRLDRQLSAVQIDQFLCVCKNITWTRHMMITYQC